MSAFPQLLGATAPWFAIFISSVTGVFVTFTGLALWVALFHHDETHAARGMEVLKELLRFFRKSPR